MRVERIRPNSIPSEQHTVAQCAQVADALRSLQSTHSLRFAYTDRAGVTGGLSLEAAMLRQRLLKGPDGLGYSLSNLVFEVGRVEHFAGLGVIERGSEVDLTKWLDKMKSPTAVYGSGWGEEGKRQLEASYGNPVTAVRLLGGPNAGSVIYTRDGEKVPLRHFPGGILNPSVERIMLAAGTNVGLATALDELRNLQTLQAEGRLPAEIKLTPDRISIDPHCHVVFDHYALLSSLFHDGGLGTEETGQGAAMAAIYGRQGDVTLKQLAAGGLPLQIAVMRSLAEASSLFDTLNRLAEGRRLTGRGDDYDYKKVIPKQQALLAELKQFADCDNIGQVEEIGAALRQNKIVHFLATQGFGLDPFTGIRPYVTSSHTGIAGLLTGLGLPDALELIPEHMAVIPAYLTCKGDRPFVTQIKEDGLAQKLRESAGQFDRVMTKDRRIVDDRSDKKHRVGYMDAVMLDHYLRLNPGVTQAALTKLDVWDGFDTVRVGVGYEYDGPDRAAIKRAFGDKCEDQGPCLRIRGFNNDADFLRSVRPIYREFPWKIQVRGIKRAADLPQEAVELISFLEQTTDVPIHVVKTGPEPGSMFLRNI